MRFSIEPRTKKYVKGSGRLSFAKKFIRQIWKKKINTATKVDLDAAKTVRKI